MAIHVAMHDPWSSNGPSPWLRKLDVGSWVVLLASPDLALTLSTGITVSMTGRRGPCSSMRHGC